MDEKQFIVLSGYDVVDLGLHLGIGFFIGVLVAACIASVGVVAIEFVGRGIGWGYKAITSKNALEGK